MVSIIIPVYNAGVFLEGCIRSILDLKIGKEIIVVDDGSTDDAIGALSFDNIKIIRQKNQGVSAARNRGLKEATGEWIWFVDADDKLFEHEGCKQHEGVELTKATELHEGAKFGNVENVNFVVTGFVWEENGKADSFGASPNEIPYNLWRCWFRRELIEKHDIKFTVGRKYAEDQEFILKYLLAVKNTKTAALPQIQYHYTVRPGSAITKQGVKLKKCSDIAAVICIVFWKALTTGNLMKGWVLHELKRMIKTLIVQMRS